MRLHLFGLIFLLFLLSLPAPAQRDDVTNLASGLHQADTAKINVLVEQIAALRETDPARAIKLGLETVALSQQLGFAKGVGRASGSLGWIYYRRGDFLKAFEYSIEALQIRQKINDQHEIASSLNNLAAIEFEEKQYDRCLQRFRTALAISRRLGDSKTICRSLNNLGYVYLVALNNPDTALIFTSEALQLSDKTGDDYNGS